MPCFLCFTKSRAKKHAERAVPAGHRRRRKKVAARRRKKPRSGKGFNWASANLLFRCVDSRFAEPRIFFWKGFNFVSEKLLFGCTDSRFAEPRCSLQRERLVTFCVVQKVTKKHARTCKKLPVASFCASETAETGRIANGREQGDHVSRRRLRPATSIQISARYEVLS